MKSWNIIIITSFTLSLLLTACGSVLPQATPDDEPCFNVKITLPSGGKGEPDAALSKNHISNETEITWDMPECAMTVQSYQKGRLILDKKGVESGAVLKFGGPGSGVTEIKLWREGLDTPSDSIWVTID
jgi:hypothetical protein